MTTRFKISLATGLAVVTLAAGAPMLAADTSAKATVPGQDAPQRRQGPGIGGPPRGGPGGPGMRRPGGPMGLGPGFHQLDLTDDQKAQLKAIAESHRAEVQQAGQKIGAAREGMRTLLDADTIDESAIRAKSAEVAAAEAEAAILNAKVRRESMQILTAEQIEKLKGLRTARQGQMKQRRPRGQ
jgi:Spy/CpxP family protein refolding chaperone